MKNFRDYNNINTHSQGEFSSWKENGKDDGQENKKANVASKAPPKGPPKYNQP
jgi:hypothetical protein